MYKYDFIIVGGGLGGLACGTILSKEGYKVCVLEKNAVLGGCLQSFSRKGDIFDTGIHYVGSLDEGEILHQYLKYFGIIDKLKTRRLDSDAYDVVNIAGEEYAFSSGFEKFADTLSQKFPTESKNIREYVDLLKTVGNSISVEKLRQGLISESRLQFMEMSCSKKIASLTTNPQLRAVLSGNSMLYAGNRDTTSFYTHAMINSSNISGPYRFVDGSQQIADRLAEQIRQNGGEVRTHSQVTHMHVNNGVISSVEINNSEIIESQMVISSIHPLPTFEMVEKNPFIKNTFLSRIRTLENSYGLFTVYLVMKKNSVPYRNCNYLFFSRADDIMSVPKTDSNHRINAIMLAMQASGENPDFCRVISLISPMYIAELETWKDTTVNQRGEGYKNFVMQKTEEMVAYARHFFPSVATHAECIYTASPLTYRDYTGTPEGSAYGIVKDCRSLIKTLIPVRTKIKNLYLTGQNINVHGMLGVCVTAAATCGEILGIYYLAKKIGNA
ncbi:MAG: NAD(P)/FAD-dependent oxidoreductase [Prolixibacteraceae bacterium]|nr:NAD(P)/FAD-dependent oxidoreductase [Prolixibacteraceae bacterium]